MEGMASGESRDVEITMPDTWDPPQLRGVRVRCSVAVNEIFEWELPEVCMYSRVSRPGDPATSLGRRCGCDPSSFDLIASLAVPQTSSISQLSQKPVPRSTWTRMRTQLRKVVLGRRHN